MKWLLNVKTVNVKLLRQTFALKTWYQEDKSQDFKIIGNEILIDVFECSECGEYGETYRELTRYAQL